MVDHAWACPTHAARRLLILFMKAIGRGVGPSDNHFIENLILAVKVCVA